VNGSCSYGKSWLPRISATVRSPEQAKETRETRPDLPLNGTPTKSTEQFQRQTVIRPRQFTGQTLRQTAESTDQFKSNLPLDGTPKSRKQQLNLPTDPTTDQTLRRTAVSTADRQPALQYGHNNKIIYPLWDPNWSGSGIKPPASPAQPCVMGPQ
jgi:hypothetical protein